MLALLFLATAADPPTTAASDEVDVSFRFLEAAAAAAAASSSGKLMRENTLGLCFRSLAAVAVTSIGLDSETGGAWACFLVDDDSEWR